jgi:DNA-binding beta-propeller fold protein YncE
MKLNHIINTIAVVVCMYACACRTDKPVYTAAGEIHFPNESWEPAGLAVAPDGSLLVTDMSPNAAIQVFSPRGVYLGGMGGPGEEAGYLWVPMDVAAGSDGTVFVAEFGTHRVTAFHADGAFIKTIGGDNLRTPMGVAAGKNGELYVADPGAGGVIVFDAAGKAAALWGTERGVAKAWDVAAAPNGKVAIVTADGGDVRVFNAKGEDVGRATAFGGAWEPVEATFDRSGNLYLVGRRKTPQGALEPWVAVFTSDGRFKESFAVDLTEPSGIAAGPDGKVYVGDGSRHKVLAYNKTTPDGTTAGGTRNAGP